MRFKPPLVLAAFAALLPAPPPARAEDAPQPGVWTAHELTFTYIGFTSHYSCPSLADKLQQLLRLAGARPDAKAFPGLCDSFAGGPSRISSAQLSFRTLAPAPREAAAAPAAAPADHSLGRPAPVLKATSALEPGIGAWRRVEWRAGRPAMLDRGDCELVAQFAQELLPLFTTRALENHTSCTPHDLGGSLISVKFDALGALPPAERPTKAPPQ